MSKSERKVMGSNASEIVTKNYDEKIVINAFFNVLEEYPKNI